MVSSCGLVKVGRSNRPAHRARVIGWDVGEAVHVAYATEIRSDASVVEAKVHRVLRAHRVRGEWFAIDADEAIDVVMWAANKRVRK